MNKPQDILEEYLKGINQSLLLCKYNKNTEDIDDVEDAQRMFQSSIRVLNHFVEGVTVSRVLRYVPIKGVKESELLFDLSKIDDDIFYAKNELQKLYSKKTELNKKFKKWTLTI